MKLIAARTNISARSEELMRHGFVPAYVQSCSDCDVSYRVFYKDVDDVHDTIEAITGSIDQTHPEHVAEVVGCNSKAASEREMCNEAGST